MKCHIRRIEWPKPRVFRGHMKKVYYMYLKSFKNKMKNNSNKNWKIKKSKVFFCYGFGWSSKNKKKFNSLRFCPFFSSYFFPGLQKYCCMWIHLNDWMILFYFSEGILMWFVQLMLVCPQKHCSKEKTRRD